MKFTYLILLFCIISLACSEKKHLEIYSYKTNDPELLLIEIDRQNNKYVLNCIIEGTFDNVNVFGLIKFTGDFPTSTNKEIIRLSDAVLFNEIKFSNGKKKKAPIDTSANLKFNLNNHNLTYCGKELTPINKNTEHKSLINLFNNWNGEKVILP